MKKVFGKIFALLTVFTMMYVIFGGDQKVEAATFDNSSKIQILYSKQCCDSANVVRCVLENWTPIGNPCFCYGQGWGYAC